MRLSLEWSAFSRSRSQWQENSPQRTRSWRPLEAHLDIDIALVHIVQIIQNEIALSFIQSDDGFGHSAIDPERLPSGRGMHTDNGMNALDVLGASIRIITIEICVCAHINGLAAIDDPAEFRAQFRVRSVSACPESIAPNRWDRVVVEVSDACGVQFVDKITMRCQLPLMHSDKIHTCAISMLLRVF